MVVLAVCLASYAEAQTLHKCTDKSGKVVYQDRPCDTGKVASRVERSNLTESEARAIERERSDKEYRNAFDAAIDGIRRRSMAHECAPDAVLTGNNQREKICLAVGRVLRCNNIAPDDRDVILFKATRDFGVKKADYGDITSGRASIGMNSCSVIAALGHPERVNRTTTSSGTREQLVYGDRKYVYLDNGVVTAWQD